ncbi:MAG: ArsR family transcriptional regulator [Gallionella sp.]|jgi:DeoR/GlpR family transcriptional regulator of sugar metabolism|nr:ArsR family transcriptional regulator [Gallionella sp.]
MNKILQYLKINGERLDTDIAAAVGLSLAAARIELAGLSSQGEVMSCHSIKFVGGHKIEGMSYRLSGLMPKAAPGRKSS